MTEDNFRYSDEVSNEFRKLIADMSTNVSKVTNLFNHITAFKSR